MLQNEELSHPRIPTEILQTVKKNLRAQILPQTLLHSSCVPAWIAWVSHRRLHLKQGTEQRPLIFWASAEHGSRCHSNLKVRLSKHKRKWAGPQAAVARLNYAVVARSNTEITFLSHDTPYSNEHESEKVVALSFMVYTSCFYYSSYLSAVRCGPNDASPMEMGRWNQGDKLAGSLKSWSGVFTPAYLSFE